MTGRLPGLVPGPGGGQIEILVTGRGEPSSLFVHGLAGSIATTRPYAGAVGGRRTFMHLAGHGRTSVMLPLGGVAPPASDWSYAALAGQVRAVADRQEVTATRALGISTGAGALCAVVADDPGRFERLVLVLPAAIDSPRDDTTLRRFATLGALVEQGDVAGVSAHLLAEQPASARSLPDVQTWCNQQARLLMTSVAAGALETVPHEVPLTDRSRLRAVDVPVLVIAQEDDPTHPVRIARELAQVLPTSTLEVLPAGGIIWEHRARVRAMVGDFLSPSPAAGVQSLGMPPGGPDD